MIFSAKHLWKPVVKGAEKAKTHAAEDDIMKVTNDPVGVVEVDIGGQGSLKEARETSDGKMEDKRESK
jgi:hypothetical protein